MGVGDRLRALVARPGVVVQPSVARPFEALLAQALGYEAIALGGYAIGAAEGLSEPLITVADLERAALAITRVVDLPLMIDAGAGYGDHIHLRGAIRRLEQVGVAAIHIEDQVYPKRVHYHRGVEGIVPREVLAERIATACTARTDPGLVIVARTDAMRTDGYEEAIERARMCRDAGADMLMMFPNNDAEAAQAPKDLAGLDLIYVNSSGNRFNRGVYSIQQLLDWGWKMDYESALVTNVAARAVERALKSLIETGVSGEGHSEMVAARKRVEDVIRLDTLYDIETSDLGISGGM